MTAVVAAAALVPLGLLVFGLARLVVARRTDRQVAATVRALRSPGGFDAAGINAQSGELG